MSDTAHREPVHHDPVHHPAHYNQHPSGIECIAIARHFTFCVGNAIKYCWRAGLKPLSAESSDSKRARLQDLKKAAGYLNDEITALENALLVQAASKP